MDSFVTESLECVKNQNKSVFTSLRRSQNDTSICLLPVLLVALRPTISGKKRITETKINTASQHIITCRTLADFQFRNQYLKTVKWLY
jgi:hypothetical protein